MALTPATRLGPYEIIALLGAGGMGEVYRARHLRLGREVAVKVLPVEVASNPDRLARFEREARIVAGLNHPNIVTLYSVEDEDGIRFLTMELVEGRTLADLIAPGGLPLARALDLGVAIADALSAAHDRGVVHRDLKPANVMVTREGRVKVLDFGLAKPGREALPASTLAPTAAVPRSETGVMMGTAPYMAPEQIRGEAVDARADLFALGILLYEVVSGRHPFAGSTAMAVSAAILMGTPEPLTRVRAGLPRDLERIVQGCLEKDPRQRAQSALEVGNELRRLGRQVERSGAERAGFENVASIAVLPFVNRSASAEDEYFADGLADELVNVLAKIKGVRVSARTSSFHFKGKDATIAEVGSTLKVATVLEGSVRKVGNRVRISVQLVKVSDGYHLWSETYDRMLEDIFALQDDIAHSVVRELRRTLLGDVVDPDGTTKVKAEISKAAKGRTTDPEAHRLFLLGRHLFSRWNPEDMAKGIDYLEQAVARDPAFALAWAELGASYAIEADRTWVPVAKGYEQARGAVERALGLEPDLVEGHAAMGWIRTLYDWDWQGAEASFARALELAPGNATALRRAGALAFTLGRLEEAVGLFRRTLEQDPLSAPAYHNLGHALRAAGRLAEAEAAYRKALELAPQRAGTCSYLSLTLLALGRGDEALAEATREPDEACRLSVLPIVHHAAGRGEDSEVALRELIEEYSDTMAYQVAEVHGARGEADAAFEWLERAYAQRDGGLVEMKTSPQLRSLHGYPHWGVLMKKMGLED